MDKCQIIDFHSHILPNADHGSTSVDISIKQIQLALKYGVETIVATPHFYPHSHGIEEFLELREECYHELIKELEARGINVNIKLSAEVLLCPGLDRLPHLDRLCIEGTRNLLIELPFTDFNSEYLSTLENLIDAGYNVILAHVDRYDRDLIESLTSLCVSFQINADSLDKLVKHKYLYEWIERDIVVALGSDIHMLDKKSYMHLYNCKKKLKDNFDHIMRKSYELIYNS